MGRVQPSCSSIRKKIKHLFEGAEGRFSEVHVLRRKGLAITRKLLHYLSRECSRPLMGSVQDGIIQVCRVIHHREQLQDAINLLPLHRSFASAVYTSKNR